MNDLGGVLFCERDHHHIKVGILDHKLVLPIGKQADFSFFSYLIYEICKNCPPFLQILYCYVQFHYRLFVVQMIFIVVHQELHVTTKLCHV